jgi:hypothetical protein
MSTHLDRIDAAKRRVLAAHDFVFDPRRLAFINAMRPVIPIGGRRGIDRMINGDGF